jgi:hypothetical protein
MRINGPQAESGNPSFSTEEISQVAAFVASLGPGPSIPSAEQVDPELAEALVPGGARLLDACVGRGLFLTDVGDGGDGPVYRWHALVAAHARAVLARRDPLAARVAHRVVAAHLGPLDPAAAIRHALDGHAPDLAARVLGERWPDLVVRGDVGQVRGLRAALPPRYRSDPDVLLLSVADGTLLGELRAVDVPTGRTLWAQEGSAAATNLIVLDDTVYGSTGQTLWARDLATGRTVWETATDQSQTAGYLLTDGSALLRSETDRRAGEAVLAAYGLHDGEQRWTTPLPDGITSAAVVGDLLVGWGAAGPRVLG